MFIDPIYVDASIVNDYLTQRGKKAWLLEGHAKSQILWSVGTEDERSIKKRKLVTTSPIERKEGGRDEAEDAVRRMIICYAKMITP